MIDRGRALCFPRGRVMKRWRCALIVAVLGCVAPGRVTLGRATVVEPLSVGELAARADVVVQGRVVAVASAWHGAHAVIYTVATVEVVASLAGGARPGERIAVRRIGGKVGEVEQVVADNAVLDTGDEAVLFLRRGAGFYTVIGMAQGVRRVHPGDGLVEQLRSVVEAVRVAPPSP
jgi:hypothetical protein